MSALNDERPEYRLTYFQYTLHGARQESFGTSIDIVHVDKLTVLVLVLRETRLGLEKIASAEISFIGGKCFRIL